MAWSGLNRREFPRIRSKCEITLIKPAGQTIQTVTENIGQGGICVILNQSLEKLAQVGLKIELESQTQPLESQAKVVWVVKSKTLGSSDVSYDTGLEFVNLSETERDRIGSFIEIRVSNA